MVNFNLVVRQVSKWSKTCYLRQGRPFWYYVEIFLCFLRNTIWPLSVKTGFLGWNYPFIFIFLRGPVGVCNIFTKKVCGKMLWEFFARKAFEWTLLRCHFCTRRHVFWKCFVTKYSFLHTSQRYYVYFFCWGKGVFFTCLAPVWKSLLPRRKAGFSKGPTDDHL